MSKQWLRYVLAFAIALAFCGLAAADKGPKGTRIAAPVFQVDPSWPRTLPNNWVIGQTGGMAVDSRDHVWLLQRPRSIAERYLGPTLTPPRSTCCIAAPSVIEFDTEGRVVRAWGGPSDPGFLENRCTAAMGCEWPETEHGIFVSPDGYVYIGGNGGPDHQVLKFTRDGTFVMQIGRANMRGPSHPVAFAPNGTPLLGRPAEMDLDREANELYIADGYQNRRVIVVDATSGQYKRHWGAYGNVPSDAAVPPYVPGEVPPQQFRTPVHCVAVANDGLVYVCDRVSNRIQVFRKNGTFVKRVLRRAQHARQRLGLQRRPVPRPQPDLPLQRRRREPAHLDLPSPDRPDPENHRPRRAAGGRVHRGAQPRGRLEGKHLYRRGRCRHAGTEVHQPGDTRRRRR